MLWLGIAGRVKIGALEARCTALETALEKTQAMVRELDLEITSQIDRLAGIAKRIQGRRGGRPPAEERPEAEPDPTNGFSRHVL